MGRAGRYVRPMPEEDGSGVRGGPGSQQRSRPDCEPEPVTGPASAGAGDPRRRLGARAEVYCARKLERLGWQILDRNWRIRLGEIDIVAIDGRTLVVVEVKAQRSGNLAGPVLPALAVGPQKQRRLRRLALAWLEACPHQPDFDDLRFDVVGITVGNDNLPVSYSHLENAF